MNVRRAMMTPLLAWVVLCVRLAASLQETAAGTPPAPPRNDAAPAARRKPSGASPRGLKRSLAAGVRRLRLLRTRLGYIARDRRWTADGEVLVLIYDASRMPEVRRLVSEYRRGLRRLLAYRLPVQMYWPQGVLAVREVLMWGMNTAVAEEVNPASLTRRYASSSVERIFPLRGAEAVGGGAPGRRAAEARSRDDGRAGDGVHDSRGR